MPAPPLRGTSCRGDGGQRRHRGGPRAWGQLLPAAGPVPPGPGGWQGAEAGRGVPSAGAHLGFLQLRHGLALGLLAQSLPVLLQRHVRVRGAARVGLRGALRQRGDGSARPVLPRSGEPSPEPDPAAICPPPQHPLAHRRSLGAAPLAGRGQPCPVASRRGYGGPRDGAAVPSAPARNAIPSGCLHPSRCHREGDKDPRAARCSLAVPHPREGQWGQRGPHPPKGSLGCGKRALGGDSGSPQDEAGDGGGGSGVPAHPPAPGARAWAGGSRETPGIPGGSGRSGGQ